VWIHVLSGVLSLLYGLVLMPVLGNPTADADPSVEKAYFVFTILAGFRCRRNITLSAIAVFHTMYEEFANESNGNMTSTTSLLSPNERVSLDQLHACAVYIMVMFGIVQLVITVIGLVGKLHHASISGPGDNCPPPNKF